MRTLLITLTLLFSSLSAFAGPFRITNCTGSAALCTALENEVNKNLPNADATTYLKGMSNALVMAGKGTGADYATNFDLFLVGANVGVGADTGGSSLSDVISGDVDPENLRGVGAHVHAIAGLNLKVLPFKSLENSKLYFNFGAFDKTSGEFKIKTSSFGVHYQQKIIKDRALVGFKLLHWGGVDVTTGLEYGKNKINYSTTLNQTVSVSGQSATYSGPVAVVADTKTTSVPVEISTSLQYLYFLSTYVGLGADFSSGKGTAVGSSTGTITSGAISGTGAIDLGTSGKPDAFDARYFVGQQFNFPLVKLYVQMNQSFANDVVGVAAGVKVAW